MKYTKIFSIILSLTFFFGCTTNNNLLTRSDGRFLHISTNNNIFFEAEFLSTDECLRNYQQYFGNLKGGNSLTLKNSNVLFACSIYSEERNLPFTGFAKNIITEQTYPLRFKSLNACQLIIDKPNTANKFNEYVCTEPLYDGMPKDRYCAIEKKVGKNNYGGITISRASSNPKVICD